MKKSEVKLKIFSKSWNGGNRTFGLTEKTSPSKSSQLLPIEVPSIGFICKGSTSTILNFYAWDGTGFKTFPSWSGEKLTEETYKEFLEFTKL